MPRVRSFISRPEDLISVRITRDHWWIIKYNVNSFQPTETVCYILTQCSAEVNREIFNESMNGELGRYCKHCLLFQLVDNDVWFNMTKSTDLLSTYDSRLRYQTMSGCRVMQNNKHFCRPVACVANRRSRYYLRRRPWVALPNLDICLTCRRLKIKLLLVPTSQ